MPLILLGGAGAIAGLLLSGQTWIKSWMDPTATQTVGGGAPSNQSAVPWYVIAVLVIIGGLLIYKVGAKFLKV
jgi:hypothetical protein